MDITIGYNGELGKVTLTLANGLIIMLSPHDGREMVRLLTMAIDAVSPRHPSRIILPGKEIAQ